jgi:hypothetical protein
MIDRIPGQVWHGYKRHSLSAHLDFTREASPSAVTCLKLLRAGDQPPPATYEVKYRPSTNRKYPYGANVFENKLMDRPAPSGKLRRVVEVA